VVTALARRLNSSALNSSAQQWLACREQLLHVTSLNRELILTDRLLAWSRLLAPPVISP